MNSEYHIKYWRHNHENWGSPCEPYYVPLRPTGRWRIVWSPNQWECSLEIEQPGFLFNRWIDEDDIELRIPETIYTNGA